MQERTAAAGLLDAEEDRDSAGPDRDVHRVDRGIVALLGATAGAFVETIESRVNDNIRVGIASAVVIVSTHSFLFGL